MKKFRLDDKTKTDPFEAPDGYFEEFPLRMQKRIGPEAGTGRPLVFRLPLRWSVPALAAILAVAIGLPMLVGPGNGASSADPLAGIATAELVYYLEMEAVTAEELVEAVEGVVPEDSLWNDQALDLLPENELSDEELLMLYEQLSGSEEIL